jgi:4,5-DOPA dioxygenase extradiol
MIMERKDFIKTAAAGVLSLTSLKAFSELLPKEEKKMPVLFIGHGSPMNAIEENQFTKGWKSIASDIPMPAAILVVSAHWLTRGTKVTAMQQPKTIHDFGGFPEELFATKYPAPGNPLLAKEISSLVTSTPVSHDHDWGLDHGAWSIVKPMYPDANIPVLQLSIDYNKPAQYHYELAKQLSALRKKGVLIIGSGNMVHNLGMIDFKLGDKGYDWTYELNEAFKKHITTRNHTSLINYESLGKAAKLAIPSPDHYYPLLYTLGLQDKNEDAIIFNDASCLGSITMTSVRIG